MDEPFTGTSATSETVPPSDSPQLVTITKTIGDLADLVRLLKKGLSRAKPWQRQLACRLAEVDRLVDLLRVAIALERPDGEILAVANSRCVECSTVSLAIAGSRADHTTRAAVGLIAGLAATARNAVHDISLNPSFCTQIDAGSFGPSA